MSRSIILDIDVQCAIKDIVKTKNMTIRSYINRLIAVYLIKKYPEFDSVKNINLKRINQSCKIKRITK